MRQALVERVIKPDKADRMAAFQAGGGNLLLDPDSDDDSDDDNDNEGRGGGGAAGVGGAGAAQGAAAPTMELPA